MTLPPENLSLEPRVGMEPEPFEIPTEALERDLGDTLESEKSDEEQSFEAIVPSFSGGDQEWAALVERIRNHETDGMEDLYRVFSRGIRFFLCRQLGPQELDDKVHDTFVVVVQAIRKGELREPERLMGFIRTVVRRQVAAHIEKAVQARRDQAELDASAGVPDPRGNPEDDAIFRQRVELINRVLAELPERDREILTRFYVREQSQKQICSDMGLSDTQFRLLKSRAKARFGELGRKRLTNNSLRSLFLRTSGGSSH